MDKSLLSCWGVTHVADILKAAPRCVVEVLLDALARHEMADLRLAARDAGVRVREVSREELREAGGPEARLAVAVLKPFEYRPLDQVLSRAGGPRSLVVALDGVTDPGNLGAIARSARFFGASGLVLPKDRSVEVNAAAMRRSAGALAVLPVSRVVNLVRALEELKAAGFWIYGAVATGGKDPAHEAFSERACLVLGAEDEGLRPLVERTCDILLTVPGQFESLNVSACAAVLMYAWNAGKPPA